MAQWEGNQTTFADAWQLWEEVENATGASVAVFVHRPRAVQGGRTYHARVAVVGTRAEGGKTKDRCVYCEIGGARGARTVPAALVRALTELQARLEEASETATQLAAF